MFAAAEIYTMIGEYPGRVTVKIDAIAASAASVIAMAGDNVLMSPVAMLMCHDPSTIAMGNTRDMEKAIEMLNKVKESIISAYMARTGLSHNRISKLMENETCIPAKEAVQLGFADEILFENKAEGSREVAEDETEDQPEQEHDDGVGTEEDSIPAKTEDKEKIVSNLFSTRKMNLTILNSLGITSSESSGRNIPREAVPVPDVRPPVVADAAPQPAIGMDGKTRDGAMPYELLIKQLDYLK